jgi:hypothetical protein
MASQTSNFQGELEKSNPLFGLALGIPISTFLWVLIGLGIVAAV